MASEIGVILRGNSAHLVSELQKSGAEIDKFGKKAEQSLRGVKDESQSLGSAVSVLGGQMGVALSAGFAVTKILEFRTAIQGAQVDIDKLRNALTYGMGGAAVTQEVDYLRKATNAMGLEFASTSQLYAKFAAAARGTALEGKGVKDVFESIGKAGTVMGLGAGEMQGVMLALTQILSKGTVQAEEIRGQLGERLPGAFAIASRAMGVTTAEFGKLLETGQVMSTDFLPKFAEQMEKEFAGSFEKASQSMQASMNRLSNAWTDLKTSLADDAGAGQAIASLNDKIASTFSTWALNVRGMSSSTGFKDWFYSAFYSVEGLDLELNLAKDSLAKLDKNLAAAPSNIYARSAVVEMRAYIKELEIAKQKQDALQGLTPSNSGPGNVSSIAAQYPSRSQSYATEEARLGKIKAAMLAVQVTASGVDASFQKHLSALYAGFKEGLINQEQYVSDVAALIQKEGGIRKGAAAGVSEASKANAAAVKADIDGARLMMEIKEKAQGEEMKRQEKLREELEKTMESYAKAAETGVAASMAAAVAAETELANYGLLKSEVQALTLAHLEQSRESAAMAGEDVANIETRIAAQKRLIAATRGLEGRAASEEAAKLATQTAKDAAAEWQKTSDKINDTLTDALMRGFESGKDFARNLRDTVVNMFKAMVLRPIISAVMNPIAQGITGAMGLSGAASAASTGSSLLSAAGMASSAYSIGTTIAGMAGTAIGAATGGLVAANAATVTLLTGSAASAAAAATAAATAGGAAASAASTAAAAGSSAAASLASVALPALAAVAVLAAFGAFRSTKQTGTGISGTLGDDASLTGFNEMRKSGYLFGGPKYWDEIKAMDPLMAKALKTDFANIKAAATGAADALGLAATEVAGFEKAFRIEFTGDQTKDAALYTELMAGVSEDLARTIIGSYKETITTVIDEITSGFWDDGYTTQVERQVKTTAYTPSEFAKEGETASQTLQRLAGSITLVNGTSEMLGNALFDVGLKGANTASLMIDAFGGMESYAANMGAYYSNFYDQAERTAYLTETTSQAFKALGLTMPVLDDGARKAYRALVDEAAARDMTVESNRNAYASLMALQGPMSELAPTFDDIAQAATDAAEKTAQAATDAAAIVKKVTDDLQSQGASLQAQWDKLALSESDYRAKQIAGMTDLQVAQLDTNAALQKNIDDFEVAAAAAAAATVAATEGADRVAQAMQRLATAQDQAARSAVTLLYGLTEAAQAAVTTAQSNLATAYQREAAAMQATVSRFESVGKSFRSFADGLASSIESPALSFGRLSAEFTRLSDLARLGDVDAASKAVSVGGQLKESIIARSTSADAAMAIARLQVAALATAGIADTQASIAQQQLDQLTAQVSELVTLNASVLSVKDAIEAFQAAQNALDVTRNGYLEKLGTHITDALIDNFHGLDTSLDALLTIDEFSAGFAGMASEGTLAKLFATIDADGDGTISRLEAIKNSSLSSAMALAAMKVTGAGGTTTAAATYTGAQVLEAIKAATAAGATTADIVNAANTNIGITTADLASVATAAAATPATSTPVLVAISDYQKRIDAITYNAAEAASIVAQAQAGGIATGISAEAFLVNYAKSIGWNAGMVDKVMGWGNGTTNSWATANGYAAFATGGAFTNGVVQRPTSFAMGQMGEAGPEAIMPLANINGSLGVRFAGNNSNDALVAEIRALRQELAELRQSNTRENVAIASHAANTADSTRKLAKDGVEVWTDPASPINTKVAA